MEALDIDLAARLLRIVDLDHNDESTQREFALIEDVIEVNARLRPYDAKTRDIVKGKAIRNIALPQFTLKE